MLTVDLSGQGRPGVGNDSGPHDRGEPVRAEKPSGRTLVVTRGKHPRKSADGRIFDHCQIAFHTINHMDNPSTYCAINLLKLISFAYTTILDEVEISQYTI